MDRDRLRDDQWSRILPLIPGGSEGKRGPRTDNRRFIQFRRVATRYDKLLTNFMGFVKIAAIAIMLK